ncbi:hypothetical protein DJ68_04270, partial [Halorubrum sp. C3]
MLGAVGKSAAASNGALNEPNGVPQAAQVSGSSPELEKWVDEVPRPGVIEPQGTKEGQPYYEVEIQEVEQ